MFDVLDGALEAVPPLGTAIPAEFLTGIARAQGQVVPVLDLVAALAEDDDLEPPVRAC